MKALTAIVVLVVSLSSAAMFAAPALAASPAPSPAPTSGVATGCGGLTLGTPGLEINCTGGKNPIYALIQTVISWVVRLLIVGATIMIVISGIQYITSQGNPEGIKGAKKRLTNAIVGLILLSLMFVILRVLGVPV